VRHHPATTSPGGQVLTPVIEQQNSVYPPQQVDPGEQLAHVVAMAE
jgi:hypothetical protein